MTESSKTRPVARAGGPVKRILVVDDEESIVRALSRALSSDDRLIDLALDGAAARDRLEETPYDLVVSDVHMPAMSGDELLRIIRGKDLDLPVILMTGEPSLASAMAAVELGAFRYLLKPFDIATVRKLADDALGLRELARTRDDRGDGRAALERRFRSAMLTLRMDYQPIVDARLRAASGYEALLRSSEAALGHPSAVVDAATKLGMLHVLGRRTRELVATQADDAPGITFHLNIHPADLADADLYDPSAWLSRHAKRVVLELTERASLESIPDLDARFAKLRALGYRLCVDDLGAGHAGLGYFARVQPDVVKLDPTLVRGIDAEPLRQRIVLSIVRLATELGMETIAEGIETVGERDTVMQLGCTHLQGFALGRPGPAFPSLMWP